MKKYPKDGCIVIPPLTISWSTWRALARIPKPQNDLESILRDVSAWQKRVDAWIGSLTERQKHDLLQLAMAEIDILYAAADTPKDSAFLEDERLDFRTRFYELVPLVATCERLNVPDVQRVRQYLNGLESYVTERMEWLP